MSTEILMPALSPTMTEGKLAKWLKNEGDEVKAGDVIAEIETDKATMEVEAVDEGKLQKILVPAGTEGVKVNTPIARIQGEDEAEAPAEAGAEQARRRLKPLRLPLRRAGERSRRAESRTAGRAGGDRRHHHHDRARGAARRHGGGDAPRPERLPDGRGGRRVSGRL